MGKVFLLIFSILMSILCIIGYVYLTKKIDAGDDRLAKGKLELIQGEQMLADGKAKLAKGQSELSTPNQVYHLVKSIPFMGIVDSLPISSTVMNDATQSIRDGNQMVARGEVRIKNGEEQLKAGQLQLTEGAQRLIIANEIRTTFAFGAIFFALLTILLICYPFHTSVKK